MARVILKEKSVAELEAIATELERAATEIDQGDYLTAEGGPCSLPWGLLSGRHRMQARWCREEIVSRTTE